MHRIYLVHWRPSEAESKVAHLVAWDDVLEPLRTSIDHPVDDPIVPAIGLGVGLADHKICAIDAPWSGLRFAWRKKEKKVAR